MALVPDLTVSPHVESKQNLPVPDVEPTAANHRMGPITPFAAWGQLELADDLRIFRPSRHQADLTFLAENIEHAIGTGERTLAYQFLLVHHVACCPIEAKPVVAKRAPVDVAVENDEASVVVVESFLSHNFSTDAFEPSTLSFNISLPLP